MHHPGLDTPYLSRKFLTRTRMAIVLFVFCFGRHSYSQDSLPSDYLCLQEKNFNVFYNIADSTSARKAVEILKSAYEEITWDFHVSPNDTFIVLIVASRSEFQKYIRESLPSWTEAVATPYLKKMMVKSPRWASSEESFNVSLVHELLHLILFCTTNGKPIPRWLDEGLAIFYSSDQRWKTATAMSRAMVTNSLIPLNEIDRVLSFQRIKAELAYQESFSATQYLLTTYDIDAIQTILTGIRDNKNLNAIFLDATGSDFMTFEREWIHFAKKNDRWFWLSDINDFLWIVVLALFLSAIIIIRLRNKKTMQKWEQEPQQEFEQKPDGETGQPSDQNAITE
jgi:hypothetical protein